MHKGEEPMKHFPRVGGFVGFLCYLEIVKQHNELASNRIRGLSRDCYRYLERRILSTAEAAFSQGMQNIV